jgi:hypothetical protein
LRALPIRYGDGFGVFATSAGRDHFFSGAASSLSSLVKVIESWPRPPVHVRLAMVALAAVEHGKRSATFTKTLCHRKLTLDSE